MTKRDLKYWLNRYFDKWKVVESYGNITIKVDGPMDSHVIAYIDIVRPTQVVYDFYSMNFFERFFTRNRTWETKF